MVGMEDVLYIEIREICDYLVSRLVNWLSDWL